MALSNSGNDYAGDTVLTNGRVSIGGIGEVIPDGPGKGNLVMIGEGYLAAGQGTNTYLNLNGNTETINGLISSRGFEGNPSDPSRIFIENSLSNSIGTLNIGGNNASSSFAGTIRDFNPTTAGLAVAHECCGFDRQNRHRHADALRDQHLQRRHENFRRHVGDGRSQCNRHWRRHTFQRRNFGPERQWRRQARQW